MSSLSPYRQMNASLLNKSFNFFKTKNMLTWYYTYVISSNFVVANISCPLKLQTQYEGGDLKNRKDWLTLS